MVANEKKKRRSLAAEPKLMPPSKETLVIAECFANKGYLGFGVLLPSNG